MATIPPISLQWRIRAQKRNEVIGPFVYALSGHDAKDRLTNIFSSESFVRSCNWAKLETRATSRGEWKEVASFRRRDDD